MTDRDVFPEQPSDAELGAWDRDFDEDGILADEGYYDLPIDLDWEEQRARQATT